MSNINGFVNGLPTYGKWGGPGWSAGHETDGRRLTEEDKKEIGINPMDELFRLHDFAYDEAEDLDFCDKRQAILAADLALVRGLSAMDSSSLDLEGQSYKAAATYLFWSKIIYYDAPTTVPCEVSEVIDAAQRFIPRRDPLLST